MMCPASIAVGTSCRELAYRAGPPTKPRGLLASCGRLNTCKPLRSRLASSAAGEAGTDGEAVGGSLPLTIQHLDDLLGVQEAQEAAQAGPSSSGEAPQESELPLTAKYPEWAQLPPEELQRRESLLRRRQLLSQKEKALQEEYSQHSRRFVYHQQRLSLLQQQFSQLAAQQQSIQEALDPEATAAEQQQAEQQQRREMVQAALLLSGFMIALVALEGASVYFIAHKLHHAREALELLPPHC